MLLLCAQVALTALIGLPICLLVKRSWAIHRVVPSVFADHRVKENADVATTGPHSPRAVRACHRAWHLCTAPSSERDAPHSSFLPWTLLSKGDAIITEQPMR